MRLTLSHHSWRHRAGYSIADTYKLRNKIRNSKEEIRAAKERCGSAVDDFNKVSKEHSIIKLRVAKETRRLQEIEDQLRQSVVEIEKSIKQVRLDLSLYLN